LYIAIRDMRKILQFFSVYIQVLLVALAFILMVVFSYSHTRNAEYSHLRRNAEATLSNTENSIEAKLLGIERTLGNISESIRLMVMDGVDEDNVKKYIRSITGNMSKSESIGFDVHAVFDVFNGSVYSGRGFPYNGFVPEERPWYKAAVEANGNTAVTDPFVHHFDSVFVISYSRRIFTDDGKPIGVICLTVKLLEVIGEDVINMQISEGGSGGLLDRNLKCIIHPSSNYIGKDITHLPIGIFKKELENKQEIIEGKIVNYRGEKAIVFIQKIVNDWWLIVATPEDRYYKNLRDLLTFLSILGTILTIILSTILVRIIKNRHSTESRMRAMLDMTPSLGICFMNRKAEVLLCNKYVLNMFAVASTKEYSENFTKVSPEYQPDGTLSSTGALANVKRAFDEGYARFEWVHQRMDNREQIPCEVTVFRIDDDADDYMIGYIRDLREHKAMLNEIHEKTKELETLNHWHASILNAVPVPVSVQDMDGKWIFVNTATEQLLKKKREDVIGMPCYTWGLSICRTSECAMLCAKIGRKHTRFSSEGQSYKVDVEILRNLDGEAVGYIEVIQDITDVERIAKSEAENASKAKTAFLARTSHEIRTPMNAILGVTEIQLQDTSISTHIREAFLMIYNSSNLLLGIINNILDLSKIEAGKMELVFTKYDVASLINDVVQLNIMRNSKQIEFELRVDENVPAELIGDEIRVKQVLNNLLSNAFKYTKKGKVRLSITADVKKEKKQVSLMFQVSDTGQGMTPEQVSCIFTEYARFNLESNRTIEGTGLGMNIVQHLVRMMNGEISVESKIGEGSKFNLQLPQEKASSGVLGKKRVEELMQLRTLDRVQIKGTQVIREYMPYGKVLIVDDVESNLFVARGLMLPYGLNIDIVSSGFEAIDKIKAGEVYDIVFMDHMMPKMDGIEATKIIREIGYKHPIVALTANALIGQAKIFLDNGFDEFISKPIDIRQLNFVLNKLIRDKQTPEVLAEARAKAPEKSAEIEKMDMHNDKLLLVSAQDAKKALSVFESTLQNLREASDEDIRLFAIKAHSMKSVLANIGEKTLSQMAYELEKAGKDNDKKAIEHKTQGIIDALKLIIQKSEAEMKEKSAAQDADADYLLSQLKIIVKACENYDSKTASFALDGLSKMSWTKVTGELLEKISEHILHSDFEEAQSLAEERIG